MKYRWETWKISNAKWESKSIVQNTLVPSWIVKGKQISENGFKNLKLKTSQTNNQWISESC